MTTIIPPQIEYKPTYPTANPRYRHYKVNMFNEQSSSVTITGTTTRDIFFKMPAETVFNLAESYLSYQIAPAAATNYTWVNEDTFDFATQAYFGNRGSTELCNLQYANRYVKIARKMQTPYEEFITNDSSSLLYPSNTAAGTIPNILPVGTTVTNYVEPAHTAVSTLNVALVPRTRLFPLKGLCDTIFAVNKDLFFGNQEMYARFTVGPGNQIAWSSGSATDPSAAALAGITGNVVFNNVYLYLACETNELIAESVKNKVNTTGLRLDIPSTTSFFNSTTTTNANITIPMTANYGKKLRRIMHTVWDPTESVNTAMDCSNVNGSKMSSYTTWFDNKTLQDERQSCLQRTAFLPNEDDWRINKRYFKGSVIQNRVQYTQNWAHIDSWHEPGKVGEEQNLEEGVELRNNNKVWSIQGTVTANISHYTFATFTREIQIDKMGIHFVE